MAKKAKDEAADDAVADIHPAEIDEETLAQFKAKWEATYTGDNSGKIVLPDPDPDVVVLSQPQNAELMAAVLRYVAASPRAVDTVGAQLNTAPENVTRLCGVLAESLGRLAGTLD